MNNDPEMLKYMIENAEYELTRKVQETALKMLPEPTPTTLYGMDVIISPYCPDGVMLMHPSHYVSEQSRYFNQMIPCPEPPIITNKSNCRW